MSKQKSDTAVKILAGSIPMKGEGGKKYKIRNPLVHDFMNEPLLEGVIVQKAQVTIEGEARVYVVIDTGIVLAQVYESAALDDVFKVGDIGDSVRLEYKGTKDLGGGRSYKRFSVDVWTT